MFSQAFIDLITSPNLDIHGVFLPANGTESTSVFIFDPSKASSVCFSYIFFLFFQLSVFLLNSL